MHIQAQQAIKAAKGYRQWGAYMARCFIRKNNVPMGLVRLARQLEATC